MGNQPQTKFEIFIDHEQLKQKKCAKYLGLFIDKNHGKKRHIETTNLKSKE